MISAFLLLMSILVMKEMIGTHALYLVDCMYLDFLTFLAWYFKIDLSTLGLESTPNCTNI